MQSNPNHKSLGIVTIAEQQLELMRENGNELNLMGDEKNAQLSKTLLKILFQKHIYHLESSQVFFPPYKLLVFGSHRGHHIVKVHDNVHERIQHGKEGTVTT